MNLAVIDCRRGCGDARAGSGAGLGAARAQVLHKVIKSAGKKRLTDALEKYAPKPKDLKAEGRKAFDEPVMAPIDGTVIRAGSYTLYCDHTDNFVVIEPSGRPGWELKIFHFSGLQVGVGDEVIASDTMIATGGRILPFVSQVDEFTAEPSNPHVHLEVIDTSIPDRPSSGGGC